MRICDFLCLWKRESLWIGVVALGDGSERHEIVLTVIEWGGLAGDLICFFLINFVYEQNLSKTFSGHKNAGFTLIELLVVVLIICILAAVALPQYQMAVSKVQVNQIVSEVRELKRAVTLYYLANGANPTSIEQLDLPGGWTEQETTDGYPLACFGDNCWQHISSYLRKLQKFPYKNAAWQCDLSLDKNQRPFCYTMTESGDNIARALGWEKRSNLAYYIPIE